LKISFAELPAVGSTMWKLEIRNWKLVADLPSVSSASLRFGGRKSDTGDQRSEVRNPKLEIRN
jgi:hypothetical protein